MEMLQQICVIERYLARSRSHGKYLQYPHQKQYDAPKEVY